MPEGQALLEEARGGPRRRAHICAVDPSATWRSHGFGGELGFQTSAQKLGLRSAVEDERPYCSAVLVATSTSGTFRGMLEEAARTQEGAALSASWPNARRGDRVASVIMPAITEALASWRQAQTGIFIVSRRRLPDSSIQAAELIAIGRRLRPSLESAERYKR